MGFLFPQPALKPLLFKSSSKTAIIHNIFWQRAYEHELVPDVRTFPNTSRHAVCCWWWNLVCAHVMNTSQRQSQETLWVYLSFFMHMKSKWIECGCYCAWVANRVHEMITTSPSMKLCMISPSWGCVVIELGNWIFSKYVSEDAEKQCFRLCCWEQSANSLMFLKKWFWYVFLLDENTVWSRETQYNGQLKKHRA